MVFWQGLQTKFSWDLGGFGLGTYVHLSIDRNGREEREGEKKARASEREEEEGKKG